MKKLTWIIPLLVFGLTACAGTATEDSLRPLDPAAWPTPAAANAQPLPTPFPKVALADVMAADTAPDAPPAIEPVSLAMPAETSGDAPQITAPNPATANGQPATESAAAPRQPVTGALDVSRLTPATHAQVTVSALNVRQGPGAGYHKLGLLKQGQTVDVLAVNPKQDWALVQTPGLTGWASLDYLDLMSGPEQLPAVLASTPDKQFPEGEIAPIFAAAGITGPAAVIENQTAAAPQSADVAPLVPVAVTHIVSGKTEVRPGPGAQFAPIGELSDPLESLAVLGVDPTRRWALVDPQFETSRVGWVAADTLAATSDLLAAAPEIYTGWTTANARSLRSGPGIFAPEIGKLPINNILRVVGLNQGRSWARVQPVSGGGDGWTQVKNLSLSAAVSDIPLAPLPQAAPAPVSIDPAQAEASAKEGVLALQLSSGGQIITLNANGTNLQPVTTGIDPALSPDGSLLAFTRWEGGEAGNGTLWVKNLSGGEERAVLGFIKQPKGADWSPDGSHIVINFQHEGRLTDKHVSVDLLKNSNPSVPWNAGNVDVKIENGKPYLKYTLPPDPHWGLRVVNVADGTFEDVDGGTYAFRPAWDPQQPWRVVSDGGRGLLAVDVNRPEARQALTQNLGDGSPAFAPDGRYLAVVSGDGNGADIFRLNSDGSGRIRLTQTPLWVAVTPEGQGQQWNNVSPAFSPDGTQIAFLTDRSGRWEVWVMNADGSNPRPMFSDAVSNALDIQYKFVDEHVISWR